jgi:hypothetical protein
MVNILLFVIVIVAVLTLVYYFKDNFIVKCPKCKSINKSKLLYSNDMLHNQLQKQKGFRIQRQIYYVDEEYICSKCGAKFVRHARKQDIDFSP